MRHTLLLPVVVLGAILCSCLPASAQGPAGAGAGRGPSRRSHASDGPSDWQLSLGYQYNRINLLGTPFNTNGLNVTFTRFVNNWLGVEAQVGFGFGNTGATTAPPNLNAKSLMAGGGPRLAWRGHGRIETWAHGNIGIERFRFSQTAGVLGANHALAGVAGGGIDFRLTSRTSFRVEGDWMGSRFFSMNQRSFQAVTGIVINF
jgi:hypothetical protein